MTISRTELLRRAGADGVTGPTVERDYVLAWLLVGLSQDAAAATMVFRGGSALRACYFYDYRYSADLDFSLIGGMTTDEGLEVVRHSLELVAPMAGLSEAVLEIEKDVAKVRYIGPWGRENRIKVDLADDELVEDAARLPVLPRYDDMPEDATVVGYSEDEIGAEKLRCVVQRKQCRDLYDLHYLLTNKRIDAAEVHLIFERKARHKGLDPASLSGKFDELIRWSEPRWEEELGGYVQDVPPFDGFERELRRALRPVLT